jgi:hypothetical protein
MSASRNLKPSDIAKLIKTATNKGIVITRKRLAADIGVSEAHLSRLLASNGKLGRMQQWMQMIELCGYRVRIIEADGREESIPHFEHEGNSRDEYMAIKLDAAERQIDSLNSLVDYLTRRNSQYWGLIQKLTSISEQGADTEINSEQDPNTGSVKENFK